MRMGEVFQVERHDDFRVASDRGGKNMYVIGVGQIQSRVQGFMTDNQCIGIAASISVEIRSNCPRVRSRRFSNRFLFHSSSIWALHLAL